MTFENHVTDGPEFDQYMQMATIDYMEYLESDGEVDKRLEEEIEKFANEAKGGI